MRKKETAKKTIDKKLLVLVLVLTFIGFVALADASAPLAEREFGDKFFFVKQQIMWAGIGIFSMILLSKINYKVWEKFATPLFFVTMLSLLLVFIPGLGSELLGARRWVFIGNFSFQPSEFVKLAMCIYLAKVASKNKKILAFFIPVVLASALIMFQPDLGTTMIIAVISMSQIFISGINLFYFAGAAIAGAGASLLLILTSEYRRARLLTFLQQNGDPLGRDYHIRQILYALGAGGLFGVGLGQSKQKFLFLPETATDSIFAIIAEEIGFVGASLIIFAFVFFILRILKIAQKAPDRFSQVFAVGIAAWIGGQVFLNLGSMVAVVPLTGIPLPFISYGGNALVSILSGIGILLNISKQIS